MPGDDSTDEPRPRAHRDDPLTQTRQAGDRRPGQPDQVVDRGRRSTLMTMTVSSSISYITRYAPTRRRGGGQRGWPDRGQRRRGPHGAGVEPGRARRAQVLTAGPVHSVAVSGNGRTAVSGGDDGTVRVWDLVRCPHTLAGLLAGVDPGIGPCLTR